MKPPAPSEKQVQTGVKRALRMLGWSVYDFSQPRAAMQTPGIPDLWIVKGNRAAWVEVKRPGGKLSAAQKAFRAECLRAGVEHHVWDSAAEAVWWAGEVIRGKVTIQTGEGRGDG